MTRTDTLASLGGILFLILGFAFISCGSYSETEGEPIPTEVPHYEGIAAFAITNPRFPCVEFLGALNRAKYPATEFPWGTFGDDLSCVHKFTASNAHRPHFLGVYFYNGPCQRHVDCAEGELEPDMTLSKFNELMEREEGWFINEVRLRANDIANRLKSVTNSRTRVVIFLGLEDNLSRKAAENLYETILPFFPGFEVGENSYRKFLILSESHGSGVTCRNELGTVSEDGLCQAIPESALFRVKNGHCLATLFWRAEHQGRVCDGQNVLPATTPPRERNFSPNEFEALGDLLAMEK